MHDLFLKFHDTHCWTLSYMHILKALSVTVTPPPALPLWTWFLRKSCVQQAHGSVQASVFLPQKACCPRVSSNDVLSLHGEYSLSPSAIRQISTPERNYPYCCFKGHGFGWRCLGLALCHTRHTQSHDKIRKTNHSRYSTFLSLCIIPFEISDTRSMLWSTVPSTFFFSE